MGTCEEMTTSFEADENDEVEYEIDVYLSKTLADNLYLLHYPSKHASEPPNQTECLSAKIKPKQQKLELEFSLDPDLDNYDKSRGKQMSINVDGLTPSGETFFKSDKMDKYTLSGAQAGSTDNLAIGFIRKGELHITPLHSALELRQDFQYMDKIDTLAKKSLSTAEEEEEEEEAVAVTVRFEAEKDKQMREKSYQYIQQKNANEPWINVNYHPYGSHSSKQIYDKLICSHMYNGATSGDFTNEDYRKSLVPECLRLSGYDSIRDQDTSVPRDQPISDQIKHLMINAHALRFSTILEKMPPDVDIVSVERLVQQIAVLVQGCWVVKSELLFQEDSTSFNGISGKYMISVRDYVVWLFTKQRVISRQEVLSAIYLPDADLTTIISQIATKTDRGWEFRYPYDSEFVESHRTIEQSQDIKWSLRYKKLVKELNLGICDPEGQIQKMQSAVLPRKVKRHSRSSMSEDGDESGTDTSSSTHRDSKSRRVGSPKKRGNLSPSKSPSSSSKSSKMYHMATLDVSPTFLETSPSDEIKTQLKEYVEEAIQIQFIMTLSDLKDLVSDSHLSSLCNRSDIDNLLDEALTSCGAQKLKNKWPQNTTPEPLYAFTEFGNKLDRYRNILLELFSTTARARMNLFVKTVEDELREIISDNDCRQIFEEYCVPKSGFYYLKGTISLDS